MIPLTPPFLASEHDGTEPAPDLSIRIELPPSIRPPSSTPTPLDIFDSVFLFSPSQFCLSDFSYTFYAQGDYVMTKVGLLEGDLIPHEPVLLKDGCQYRISGLDNVYRLDRLS